MKNFIIIVIIVALAVAGIVLFREWQESKKEYSTLYERYQEALKADKAAPLVIRDTIIDTVVGTASYGYRPVQTTGPIEGYVSKGFADTLAEALGVATKKIDRLQSYIVKIEGSGKGERVTDTVRKTEWLVLKNDPIFDIRVNLNNDSIYPMATIKLDQAYAPYRKNLFSRTEYRSVIRTNDIRVKISDIYDVNRPPKSPRWSIGVFGGPVATPTGLTYGLGLGLAYDVIQF